MKIQKEGSLFVSPGIGETKHSEQLIKSKKRVQQHGEVFTPRWMVEKMLDLVADDAEDVTKTFLEPAAGDGNFLLAILQRKLAGVTKHFDKRNWKTKSLFALSSIYGIEFLADNLDIARHRMFIYYLDWYEKNIGERLTSRTNAYRSAQHLIQKNIVRGNTLTKRHPETNEAIQFCEWQRVKGSSSKIQRIDFTFASLFGEEVESARKTNLISLFDLDGDGIEDLDIENKKNSSVRYPIIDIQKVYQLEEM